MTPSLTEGEFVFCCLTGGRGGDHAELGAVATIVEDEGLTLILPRERAVEHGLAFASVFRRITLTVHSSLDAVGLTAAVSRQLTDHGISANVVAGYHHDHFFVHTERAEDALVALRALAAAAPTADEEE